MVLKRKDASKLLPVILLFMPFLLTACHSDLGPFPMPSGYTYHDNPHKAPPGPEPIWKKIEHMNTPKSVQCTDKKHHRTERHSKETALMSHSAMPVDSMDTQKHDDWNAAAQDLIQRMIDDLGRPVESIYVRPDNQNTASNSAIEAALRQAMTAQNLSVAATSGQGAFSLHYTIQNLDVSAHNRKMVSITLMQHHHTIIEKSGIYNIGDHGASVSSPATSSMVNLPEPDMHDTSSSSSPVPLMPIN